MLFYVFLQSLMTLKKERDTLHQKVEELQNCSRQERDDLMKEHRELEKQFVDYKLEAVAGWFTVIIWPRGKYVCYRKLPSTHENK